MREVFLNAELDGEGNDALYRRIEELGGRAIVKLGDLAEGVPATYENLHATVLDPAKFTPAQGLDRGEIARVIEWYLAQQAVPYTIGREP